MRQVFDWMMQKNVKKISWCSWFECPHCNSMMLIRGSKASTDCFKLQCSSIYSPDLILRSHSFGLRFTFHADQLFTLCFFIRTSNFGVEAERSYVFLRFEVENVLKMFLN